MNISNRMFFCLVSLTTLSCNINSDNKIKDLLSSIDKDCIIEGAIKAGKKGKKEFIPLLLNASVDWRTSTNFSFKGVSVYHAKMEALQKIFKIEPPKKITDEPDSTIIKFYTEYYKRNISK